LIGQNIADTRLTLRQKEMKTCHNWLDMIGRIF
jgi:hypothetical protein